VAETTIGEHYQNTRAWCTGVVSAMLDEAAGRAHMVGTEPRFMYTARLEVRYRQSALASPASGRQGWKTKRAPLRHLSALYRMALLAAEVLLVDIRVKFSQADLEAIGWKVYPEVTRID
jgi:hypothetical protein